MKKITAYATALVVVTLSACSTMPAPENPQGVHGMVALKSSFDDGLTAPSVASHLLASSAGRELFAHRLRDLHGRCLAAQVARV